MPECAYVYILASKGRRLYIGMTTQLTERIWQHKHKVDPDSFTARYNIDQLVYFEKFTLVLSAIAREKELKGWLRQRKIALIVAANPTWRDLSLDWGKPVQPFNQNKVRPARGFGDAEALAEAKQRFSVAEEDIPF